MASGSFIYVCRCPQDLIECLDLRPAVEDSPQMDLNQRLQGTAPALSHFPPQLSLDAGAEDQGWGMVVWPLRCSRCWYAVGEPASAVWGVALWARLLITAPSDRALNERFYLLCEGWLYQGQARQDRLADDASQGD
jgi:hypothetical protein